MLIDTGTLARHLGDPQWVVFDTRHDLMDPGKGAEAYAAGHIPGAYFIGVDDDMAGAKNGRNGRHPLPDLAAIAAKMNACGVTPA
jgi:thiosulfate/3-mercaptopyruvate sulfurtransferase